MPGERAVTTHREEGKEMSETSTASKKNLHKWFDTTLGGGTDGSESASGK